MGIDLKFWAYQTIAMLLTCAFLPRLRVSGPFSALMTVIALAFVNAHLWSAALFFEIPDTATNRTIGLIAINAIIFWLVVKLLPGIEIDGFLPALAAPIIFTLINLAISTYLPTVDWSKVGDDALSAARAGQDLMQNTARELEKPK